MNIEARLFNLSIHHVLSEKQSILTQARIRLLYYGLLLVALAIAIIEINLVLQHEQVLDVIGGCLLFSVLLLFKYLTWRPDWTFVAHALLVIGTLVNLTDVFVVVQKVDIITIQITLIITIFSFYMIGQKWGLFYSLLNLLPIVLFMIFGYNHLYIINFVPTRIDQSTVIISVLANFVLLIFIHNHFYSAFITNIVQLRQTSSEQQKLNTNLETAINKAEKSSHAKTEFLSTMSHEIRTPLNAVIGMSNLLMMNNPRPDQEENLEILKFSASNLLAIVNDVLDFNKIESGKIVFENIQLNLIDLMNSICGGQNIKAQEKGLEFKLDIDEKLRSKVVIGDPTRITQVIYNLVSNAIKFTRQGSIWVKVKLMENRHDRITVLFSVKDTGIGIERENVEAIFEPFTQESITTTRQYGGTGLGLAIVKRLLELKGVQMKVTSTPGKGSTFYFNMEFPVSTEVLPERKVNASSATETVDDISHVHILVAEDNVVNTMLMKKLFSKWSVKVSFAENGERAVEQVQYGNFDIILMDLQMPVMNGFDAAIEIRKLADQKKANTPIIALTASALTEIREKVFQSGMNDYVSKPFKPEELKAKILGMTNVAI